MVIYQQILSGYKNFLSVPNAIDEKSVSFAGLKDGLTGK